MKILLLSLCLLLSVEGLAQRSDTSFTFDRRMHRLAATHSVVLGSWSVLNLAAGGAMLGSGQGQQPFFHAMNLSWGVVNGGVTAFLYLHTQQSYRKPKDWARRQQLQHHVEQVLLVNIGLDAAYMATGVVFLGLGTQTRIASPELWKGFGTSILMQGAFLLVQDCLFYRLHLANWKKHFPNRTQHRSF